MTKEAERTAIFQRLPFSSSISYDSVPKYHLQKAIDFCERQPFGFETLLEELMWGGGRTSDFQGVCEALQQLRSWAVPWSAVFELIDLVKTAELTQQRIAEVYAAADPGSPLPVAESSAELFSHCLYVLADRLNSPLGAFVEQLLPDFLDLRPGVEEWLRNAAIPTPRTPSAALPAGPATVLLIKVENDANTAEFHVSAWCCYRKTVPLRGLDSTFPRAELEEALTICWRETRKLLEGDALAQQQLLVEVFLPLDLLADGTLKPDRIQVKFGLRSTYAIGVKAPLVVRSLERVYDPQSRQDTWGEWNRKWKNKPAAPAPFRNDDLCFIRDWQVPPAAGDPLAFVALTMVPPGNTGIDIIAEGIIDRGLPIALWRREESIEADAEEAQLRQLLCEHYSDELPRLVMSQRSLACQNSLWHHLVLLWDDPGRLPPDLRN